MIAARPSLVILMLSALSATAEGPVRVMSYNIRYATAPDGDNAWDRRKDFLAETITRFDPDLLGTQETLAIQRDFLKQKLRGYEVCAAGRNDGRDGGEMAALYFRSARFELLDSGHFWLSTTPDTIGSKGWDAALPRIATWVKLRDRTALGAKPILFLNTHFDHRGTQARLESARLIREKLATLGTDCRLILTGDFNCAEASKPYDALFAPRNGEPALVRDTYRLHRPERSADEATFNSFDARRITGPRIDWIGASQDWEVRQAGIDRTSRDGRTPSDHFAVTAVLRPARPTPTLRVLCYNIHHGEGTDKTINLPRLAGVVRAADPDLVALQEVDDKTRRSGGVDQTAELARLTGLEARFGKAIDYDGGGYGQAILARFPLREPKVHWLPGEPDRERRIAFEARFTWQKHDLVFVTTHLHHRNANFREQQATKLNDLYRKSEYPVILAGDLNAEPMSTPIRTLEQHWLFATSDPKLLTFPAPKPVKMIDYILLRPENRFRVMAARVLDEAVASDHRPVLAEVEIRP